MRAEQKTNVRNSVTRVLLVAIAVIVQLGWIVVLVMRLNRYSAVISLVSGALSLLIVLVIYNRDGSAAMKLPWIMLIAAMPVLGVVLYLLVEGSRYVSVDRRHIREARRRIVEEVLPAVPASLWDAGVLKRLERQDLGLANEARYLRDACGFPLYDDTRATFYPETTQGMEAQLDALRRARSFVFMEYHAIEDSAAFDRYREILAERAAAGVDVRVLYDDLGSFGFIGHSFIDRMAADGIACRAFNPMVPLLKPFMDNRDHRKIMVVDGTVGFTGGYNLADEYFDIKKPYGHWKDTGLRLEGPAVASLTAFFLSMWHAMDRDQPSDVDEDVRLIAASASVVGEAPAPAPASVVGEAPAPAPVPEPAEAPLGYVQPYADDPLGNERVGENVYLNVIKNARRYVWFTTPYLIVSDEMARELTLAAKRGVDVRIVTPGIPDKKLVFRVTRSYYRQLALAGVRIYEYTPGFCHAKQCVSDDVVATVGTINLDFRSLYHHFENGVLMIRTPAVADVRRDFERTFSLSRNVSERSLRGEGPVRDLVTAVMRLAAPLL